MADAIPRKWVDNYVRTIDTLTIKAQGDLQRALMAVDISDRATIAAIMREHCKVSTEAAARLAEQFYRVMSLYQTTEDVDLAADSGFDPDAIDDATYAIFERSRDDGAKVLNELLTRIGYEVNRSSKYAMWSLGRKDGRVVTYARVPQGSETCAWCLALAGKGFHYMTRESAEHTHAHCVVGETRVAGVGLLASMRREYEGPLVRLVTAKGRKLTITPNHPVLTTVGWVSAGDLVEGDHLVCAPFGHLDCGGVPDVGHVPPTAQELFEASGLLDAAVLDGMPSAAKDFYGEMFPDCDVKVVSPDGLLERALKSTVGEPSEHEGFTRAGLSESLAGLTLDGERPLGAFLGSGLATTGCVICRGSLSSSLLGGHGGSAEESSLGASTMLDAGVTNPAVNDIPAHSEAVGDGVDALAILKGFERAGRWGEDLLAGLDACALQSPVDGGVTDAELLRNLGRSDVAPIEVDNLVSLSVSDGCCHVYNLSTKGGWYVSSGIITHNCDCAVVPSIGRKSVSIDGYDPNALADQWRDAQGRERPQELLDRIAAAKADHTRLIEQGLATNPWTSFNEQLIVMRYFNPRLS